MKKTLIATAIGLASFGANATPLLIDTFSEAHGAADTSIGAGGCLTGDAVGNGCFSSITPSAALGGERELFVDLVTDPFGTGANISVNNSGFLNFNVGSGATATASLTYDGTDGSAAIDPFGLGGEDFTSGGVNDRILVDVLFSDSNFEYEVNFWDFTSGLQVANATFLSVGGSNYVDTVDFNDAQFAAVDFSNIGAFQVIFDPAAGFTSIDMTVDNLGTGTIPEPAPLALLAAGLLGLGWTRRKTQ